MMLTLERKSMISFNVTVERKTKKRISPEKLKDQLTFIGKSATRNQTSGFDYQIPGKLRREVERGEGENREIHYTAVITITKDRYNDEAAVRRRFGKTRDVIAKAANRKGWTLVGEEALVAGDNGELIPVNGAGEPTGDPAPALYVPQEKRIEPTTMRISPYASGDDLPPLTEDVLEAYFSRIYDREAHIRIIYDNLRTAVRTNFKTRHHILLKGKPACAKSELYLAFIDWLGDDFIESVDASTMTKAGLERMLLDKASSGTLKPILVLEEIEKCAPENISCLIQVMDARGKIQRVNANTVRDGETSQRAPLIVWSTCNDEKGLQSFHDGAIWSRFGNKLHCQRPDRTLMTRILNREIQEINGNPDWVDVAIKFCFDELQNLPQFKEEFDDPRFARALLAGGDRLLDDGPEGYLADFRKATGLTH